MKIVSANSINANQHHYTQHTAYAHRKMPRVSYYEKLRIRIRTILSCKRIAHICTPNTDHIAYHILYILMAGVHMHHCTYAMQLAKLSHRSFFLSIILSSFLAELFSFAPFCQRRSKKNEAEKNICVHIL